MDYDLKVFFFKKQQNTSFMKSIITYFLLIVCLLMGANTAFSQMTARGFKGGLTVGTQRWNNSEREALFAYNASYIYEKFTESKQFSYLVDLGYHVKGSAIRYNVQNINTGINQQFTTKNKFGNVSLMLGAKSLVNTNMSGADVYYLIGARLEYTVMDSIESVANLSNYINRINYGITAGGGLEMNLNEKARLFFEVQVSPDFSQQIYMPPGNYITNYNGNTFYVQFQEQKVYNTVIELTIGLKFLKY